MLGLFQGDPNESTTQVAMGVSALEAPTGSVLGAAATEAWMQNPAPRLARAMFTPVATPEARNYWDRYRDPAGRNPTPETEEIAGPPDEGVRMLSPEEANRHYGIKGALTFDRPISEPVAKDLAEAKRAQMIRQDIINRRADSLMTGMVSRGAIGLAMGILDPINVASAFIPGVGQEAAIARIASATWLERQAIRGVYGAGQGAVGMAALEPLIYALDTREREDWSMAQALRSIAFGGVLGGGLHVAFSAPRGRITARLDAAGHDAREAALRTAIAQHLTDTPTSVDAALGAATLDTDALRSAFQARLAARGDVTTGNYAAFTPEGLRVELRPEVVEADRLIVSHNDAGAVNPAYPHAEGLQPRDRSSAASQAQITELASRLEPERLGPSPEAGAGAPIISGADVVESGNGRMMALRRVYNEARYRDQAAAYRAYIEALGFDTTGMRQPVLVGRRITDLSTDAAKAFTRGANERATLGMNAAEQARLDAGRAGKAIRDYRGGDIAARDNKGFVGAFMAQIPAEERGAMVLTGGDLSAQGAARIRQALLAHAYGDAMGPTLERFLNGDVEHMKGVAGALGDMAGAWSQLRAAVARGDIPSGLDITPAIGEAVQLLDRARSAKMTPGEMIAQMDMLDQPSAAAQALLRLMFRDEAMRQPVARAKLADLLDNYVTQAMEAKPGPGLFGEAETTAADILRTIGAGNERVRAVADALADAADPPPRAEEVVASREAEAMATEARASHAGDGAEASLFGDMAPDAQSGRATTGATSHADIQAWKRGDPLPADIAEAERRAVELARSPTIDLPSDERVALREHAIATVFDRRATAIGGSVATDRKAFVITGPPAAGKSSIAEPLAKEWRALIIDGDDLKAALPEFEGGLGAARVHEEASLMAGAMLERAAGRGANVILPIVGDRAASVESRLIRLKDAGYDVTLIHNDLPVEVAARRNMTRFRETGRLVPTDFLISLDGQTRATYQAVKSRFDAYEAYSNDVPSGHAPRLEEQSPRKLSADAGRASGDHGDPKSRGEGGRLRRASEPEASGGEGGQAGVAAPGLGSLSPEIQEALRLADDAVAAVRTEIDAGRLPPEAAVELAAADQALDAAMGTARAYQAAAACLVVGMGGAAA